MDVKPWASGPGEILRHGLSLLENDSDTNRRLALISIDNAVELMIKTYLGLPERINGLKISRRRITEIGETFPSLLDGLEEFAQDKLEGIDLGEIEWYHRLRNQMYHDGNGLTVELDKVRVYAELSKGLYSKLFGYVIISNKSTKNGVEEAGELKNSKSDDYLSVFLSTWIDITTIVPSRLLPKLVKKGILEDETYKKYNYFRDLRNKIVHGQVKSKDVLDKTVNHELKDLANKIFSKENEISNYQASQQAELDSHKAEQPRLRESIEKVQDRIIGLNENEPILCPLCGSELDDHFKEKILIELQEEGIFLAERYRRNKEKINELVRMFDIVD